VALFASRDSFVGFSSAQVDVNASWENDGAELLRGVRTTDTMINVDPGLRDTLLALMAKAAPAVATAINEDLVPVAQRAFDRWPVETGFSKSELGLELVIRGDGKAITASLVNNAPYAEFINRGQTVEGLIFSAGEAAADRMVETILRELE